MFRALPLIAATSYATLVLGGGVAHANGDPPSNVLLNAAVYLPADGRESDALVDTVDRAGKAGYDVKVAVVESVRDLGNIPQYWGQPQAYADHLADGLSFAWRGDLLIVMPGGLGLAATAQAEKKKAAIAKIRPSGSQPAALATAGKRAVRALASAAGRPLGSGGASVLPALLVLGGLLLVGGGAVAWRVRSGTDAPGDEPQGERELEAVDQRSE